EDETGLPIWALWQHYDRDRDIQFIRPLYRKLVRTGADFMATYREPRTKLPAPSFDLWEERRGIHAFTTAAVWAGLTAARNFAVAFGQHELAKRYAVAAQEIREAALTHLWDADRGRFVRTLSVLPDGTIVKDATIDISLAGIFLSRLLPAQGAAPGRARGAGAAVHGRAAVGLAAHLEPRRVRERGAALRAQVRASPADAARAGRSRRRGHRVNSWGALPPSPRAVVIAVAAAVIAACASPAALPPPPASGVGTQA